MDIRLGMLRHNRPTRTSGLAELDKYYRRSQRLTSRPPLRLVNLPVNPATSSQHTHHTPRIMVVVVILERWVQKLDADASKKQLRNRHHCP